MKSVLPAFAFIAILAAPATAAPADGGLETVPAASSAAAVDPQALQLAREYVALTSPPDMLEKQFVDQMKALAFMMPGVEIPAGDDAAALDQMFKAAGPAIRDHAPAVSEAYALAYARVYSAEELRQIVAFASTPIGKRLFSQADEIQLDKGVIETSQKLITDVFAAIAHAGQVAACQRATARRVAAGDTKAKCPMA